MFVAANGLTALADLLKPSTSTKSDCDLNLIQSSVHAISTLLAPSDSSAYLHELVTNTVMFSPRFEYCRLLTMTEAPLSLGKILYQQSKISFSTSQKTSSDLVESIINIFDVFCHAGHAVVVGIATEEVIRCWLDSLPYLEPILQNRLLTCIKLLSLDPETLATLQSANTIKVLVSLLSATDLATDILRERYNQVLNALFNLCRYNPYRQADAAASGLVPHLVRFVSVNNEFPALRHFAIPLLCDLAKSSKAVLGKLREAKACDQLVRLLNEDPWAVQALDALSMWISQEPKVYSGSFS
ncbi:hypothetical protein GEMRC1_013310 [Eukaryota sp. GEM-RC1]